MLKGVEEAFRQISKLLREIRTIRKLRARTPTRGSRAGSPSPGFRQVMDKKRSQPGNDLGNTIDNISRQEGLAPELVRAVIEEESGFDTRAVSEDGARGLMQLMPETARALEVNPDIPAENVRGGARYLGRMLDHFGNLKLALAAYNAGPNAVEEHGGIPPYGETENYVKNVLERFRRLKNRG